MPTDRSNSSVSVLASDNLGVCNFAINLYWLLNR